MRRGAAVGRGCCLGASADRELMAPSSSSHRSRIFFGKNKVMMVALGREPSSEYRENLHKVRVVSCKLCPQKAGLPRVL